MTAEGESAMGDPAGGFAGGNPADPTGNTVTTDGGRARPLSQNTPGKNPPPTYQTGIAKALENAFIRP
jgi:hypothetical protein